jgi:hypothetical protein
MVRHKVSLVLEKQLVRQPQETWHYARACNKIDLALHQDLLLVARHCTIWVMRDLQISRINFKIILTQTKQTQVSLVKLQARLLISTKQLSRILQLTLRMHLQIFMGLLQDTNQAHTGIMLEQYPDSRPERRILRRLLVALAR